MTQGHAAVSVKRAHRWRTLGVVCVGIEAVAAAASSVVLLAHAVTTSSRTGGGATSTANPRAVDLTLALTALLLAVGLAFCARALGARRPWCRGPLITWQLIQLAVSVQTLRGRGAVPMPSGQRVILAAVSLTIAALTLGAVILGGVTLPGGHRTLGEAPRE